MARMAKDINPEAEIQEFPDGVTPQNLTLSWMALTFSSTASISSCWT